MAQAKKAPEPGQDGLGYADVILEESEVDVILERDAKYGIKRGIMPDKAVEGSPVAYSVKARVEHHSPEPYETVADRTEREDPNKP